LKKDKWHNSRNILRSEKMKKRIGNLLILLVLLVFFVVAGFAPVKSSIYKKGESFAPSKLKLTAQYYICDISKGDVNGDGKEDQILLIGHKLYADENLYKDNIMVVVIDGKSGKMKAAKIGEQDAGYKPELFLGDFNGDKVKDIFINIDLGGSGGVQGDYIFSFKGSRLKQIFNGPKVDLANYLVTKFINGFKARITSKKYKINEIVSVTANKKMYIDNGN
jgi:hypothetical protein